MTHGMLTVQGNLVLVHTKPPCEWVKHGVWHILSQDPPGGTYESCQFPSVRSLEDPSTGAPRRVLYTMTVMTTEMVIVQPNEKSGQQLFVG